MNPVPTVPSYGGFVAATIARTVPPGSTIGIVTPGSPPEGKAEVGRGIAWWRSHGYDVKLAPGALDEPALRTG
jgi:muramoyltetrapeptide carboxypeptidase LdcA involved in peptidoglycan recycling